MINKRLICLILFSTLTTMAQNLKKLSYTDKNQKLNGLITDSKENNLPGVLILPAWMGIDEEAKSAATSLQEHGYIALIADIYGEGNIPTNIEEAKKITSFYKANYEDYQKRINIALEELVKQGADRNNLVVIGYCFGGTGALEAARGNLNIKGAVSIHGSLTNGLNRNNKIHADVLVLHGADDESVSKQDIENLTNEMNQSQVNWQMIYYGNSKHTFTNPASKDYNEVMSKRSWSHVLNYLQEVLKK